MINRIFSLVILLFILNNLSAQSDTISPVEETINPQIIENYIEDTGEETPFDFNTAFEDIEALSKKKLDLNKATEDNLTELLMLNDLQIQNLLKYRKELGNLISIYELQAVPGFDTETIYKILPFVTTQSRIDDIQLGILQMTAQGSDEIYLRWGRILEEQRGYQIPLDTAANRYLGNPNRLYFRYYKNLKTK